MAVFFARMVMPRSRSSAFESITRSWTSLRASSVPDWRRSWSTSVVFPWSTCAMMAMLRSLGVTAGEPWGVGTKPPIIGELSTACLPGFRCATAARGSAGGGTRWRVHGGRSGRAVALDDEGKRENPGVGQLIVGEAHGEREQVDALGRGRQPDVAPIHLGGLHRGKFELFLGVGHLQAVRAGHLDGRRLGGLAR